MSKANQILKMFNKNSFYNLLNKLHPQTNFDNVKAFIIKKKQLIIRLIYGLAAFLVILFCFNLYQKSAQEKYSELLHQSLLDQEKGNLVEAQKNLQAIYEAKFAPSGVKGLASLRYAGILLGSGNKDEALKIYQEVAFSIRQDRYLRDLAGLLACRIIVINTNANSDKIAQEEAFKQIEKIASSNKALKIYVSEQKGILAMKLGNLEKSYQVFSEILKDKNAEQAIKIRVADMIKILISQGYSIKTEK